MKSTKQKLYKLYSELKFDMEEVERTVSAMNGTELKFKSRKYPGFILFVDKNHKEFYLNTTRINSWAAQKNREIRKNNKLQREKI